MGGGGSVSASGAMFARALPVVGLHSNVGRVEAHPPTLRFQTERTEFLIFY